MNQKGKVYIIGVGPGDYKLMTLKAVECIKKAEVVVYDRLIGSKVLSFASRDAELIYVGKLPDSHAVPQDGINEILIKKALEGKTVVRVKGGDPFMFGRGGEEALSLFENGIEFEIVPGVTSAISVPAYAGIPVTHRDFCSSLHIITGHERPDKSGSLVDYEVLSKLEGTLVFLMGVKNLPEIAVNLTRFGKSKSTPVAVIEKGTTPEQRTVIGTLEDIAGKVLNEGILSPAVTVIGEVVQLQEKLKWFSRGHLAGKRIVVTRAREQASRLVQKIEDLGGEVIEFPTIRILEPENYYHFEEVLENLNSFNWLVFTSVNGVKAFISRMRHNKADIRSLSGIKLCAVGEATALELNVMGLNVDYVPEKYTTKDLLEGLKNIVQPGEKILLARADIANTELSRGLKLENIIVEDLVVYRTVLEAIDRDSIAAQLEEGLIDFITFTSSSTVSNFISIVGKENLNILSTAKVLCIGPVTAKTAEELGLKVAAVADVYTIDGLVEKLLMV